MRLFFLVEVLQLALGLYQFSTDGSSVLAWWNVGLGIFWFLLGWHVKRRENAAVQTAKREAGSLTRETSSVERDRQSPRDLPRVQDASRTGKRETL